MSMGFWQNVCIRVYVWVLCAFTAHIYMYTRARCCTTLTHDICTMLLYARVGYILRFKSISCTHKHKRIQFKFTNAYTYIECEFFVSFKFYHRVHMGMKKTKFATSLVLNYVAFPHRISWIKHFIAISDRPLIGWLCSITHFRIQQTKLFAYTTR